MKDYDKNKEPPYLKYWDVNNLYDLAMSRKLPVNKFAWIEDTSQFNQDFIKNVLKKMMKDIFSKFMFSSLKNYMNFIMNFTIFTKNNEI